MGWASVEPKLGRVRHREKKKVLGGWVTVLVWAEVSWAVVWAKISWAASALEKKRKLDRGGSGH